MLRQLVRIETPAWLANLTAEAIKHDQFPLHELLKNSLYYPSCGFDADPIRHFGGNIFSFVYVDYGHTKEAFLDAMHFGGYNIVATRFVSKSELYPTGCQPLTLSRIDGDPQRYRDHIKEPFCVWAVFQLRSDSQLTGAPFRFSLLFVCADGVATFQGLYNANLIAPKVVAVIQPGESFGFNWTNFSDSEQIFARVVQENPAGQPEMLLYGGIRRDWSAYSSPCWPTYKFLIRNYRKSFGGMIGVWSKNPNGISPGKQLLTE
jgi:hypothetical protein